MRRGWAGAALVAAAMMVAAGAPEAGAAERTRRSRHEFGMVGFASGQEVQLNVVNTTPLPTEDQIPPDPCRVRLTLFDDAGRVLATREGRLGGGQSLSLTFGGGETTDALGRREVRAQVDVVAPPDPTVPPDPYTPPDPCRSSLEIVNTATLRTMVFVSPAVIRGFNPQPDPPGRQ